MEQELLILKNEILKLKGEKAKPSFEKKKNKDKSDDDEDDSEPKPSDVKPVNSVNSDDLGEDRKPKPKKPSLQIDQEVFLSHQADTLPKDAVSLGTRSITIIDINFSKNITRYLMERFYSAGNKKTYQKYPQEYSGSKYSNNLKAFVNMLYYQGRVTHENIIELLKKYLRTGY